MPTAEALTNTGSAGRQRTVLITGASRNIGGRVAERFASKGHAVVIVARSADKLAEVESSISAEGGTVMAIPGDLAIPEEVARIAKSALERFGRVDVLVNNAVSRLHKPFLESTDEDFAEIFNVTAWSAIRMSRAFLPGMIANRWGRIVSMVGTSAQTGAAGKSGFVAAKSSLIGLTKALALEFADSGVTVNAVSPGPIATDRGAWTVKGSDDATVQAWYAERAKTVPMGRMGSMDEISSIIEFLASDDSAFITGQVINVNGGMLT
jgi:3-oxoacyl-[acyl-carrier protein] reductase